MFSSAGVTAAIDLAFSLIEEDHGRALALWVARRLVVFLKRPGGQSQFSAALTAQTATISPIERIRLHILASPRAALGLEALAELAGVSPRHLSRLFRAELGMNPVAYVELTRLDIARRLLEDSAAPIKAMPIRPASDRRRRSGGHSCAGWASPRSSIGCAFKRPDQATPSKPKTPPVCPEASLGRR